MRIPTLLSLMVFAGMAWGQVYTWVDEDGNTHYGDRPPAEGPAETLDIDTSGLSTMGGAGLRPAEEAALERIYAEEQAAAERRLERRRMILERRRLETERRAAEAALEQAHEPVVRRRPAVYPVYPVIPYPPRPEPRYGVSFSYSDGDASVDWGYERPYSGGRSKPRDQRHYPGHRPKPPVETPPTPVAPGGSMSVFDPRLRQ